MSPVQRWMARLLVVLPGVCGLPSPFLDGIRSDHLAHE
jgi:hypothetical protein